MSELIPLPESLIPFLNPYLPNDTPHPDRPFVTLTYAQSIDSRISVKPGIQTKLSHMETKTMTHYLRAHHDAILVGIGTVLADDPKLNCRFLDSKSPRPIIIDPHAKWKYHNSTLYKICNEGKGLAPVILVDESASIDPDSFDCVVNQGGKYLKLPLIGNTSNWSIILAALKQLGVKSVMIEGGARIINDLLDFNKFSAKNIIDSLIITIAPVFLGIEGVQVSPSSRVDIKDITWWHGIQDTILCGRP